MVLIKKNYWKHYKEIEKLLEHLDIDDKANNKISDLYPLIIQLDFYSNAYDQLRQEDHYYKIINIPNVLLRMIQEYIPITYNFYDDIMEIINSNVGRWEGGWEDCLWKENWLPIEHNPAFKFELVYNKLHILE